MPVGWKKLCRQISSWAYDLFLLKYSISYLAIYPEMVLKYLAVKGKSNSKLFKKQNKLHHLIAYHFSFLQLQIVNLKMYLFPVAYMAPIYSTDCHYSH